jgi:multiple sugar transport system ATP-binding protein
MASIRLDHITKRFGDGYPAVNDVSLDIADGEFMILVGPSGCGKSTILRMIVGLEDITEGDVHIGDELVNDKAPRDRNLAMVFQNYALYPHLTVYENIAFPLRLRKEPSEVIDKKVHEAGDLLELEEYLDRKPANLSGGQRQRVAMGRALVRDAAAFLFDEPLSNLDAKLRGQMRTEISRIQTRLGMTTVYVTHDQIEAMTLGDRVAVLRKGILQQVVAGFIGSPSMNFLPAWVEGQTLHLPIADVQITPEIAEEISQHDVLIAGIRPEHFEVTEKVPEERRAKGLEFRDRVDVIEWLGSGQFAYIPFDAPPEVAEPLAELAEELDSEQIRTQLVVALDAESDLKEGEEAELWVDPGRMQLFDPRSGDNLTHRHGTEAKTMAPA